MYIIYTSGRCYRVNLFGGKQKKLILKMIQIWEQINLQKKQHKHFFPSSITDLKLTYWGYSVNDLPYLNKIDFLQRITNRHRQRDSQTDRQTYKQTDI